MEETVEAEPDPQGEWLRRCSIQPSMQHLTAEIHHRIRSSCTTSGRGCKQQKPKFKGNLTICHFCLRDMPSWRAHVENNVDPTR
jgi:hypothetical protein